MAGRKALRIPKSDVATASQGKQQQRFTSAKLIHPHPVKARRGVARAHAKHQRDNDTVTPGPLSLADRFHALPSELRMEVFTLLLVQPVKWHLDHDACCPLFTVPTRDIRPKGSSCARCTCSDYPPVWRMYTTTRGGWQGAYQNPWRSTYAPQVANDFMCSDCWDEHFREGVVGIKFPKLDMDMPCLCARRTDLDILLVCQQWYEEASRVLWTSNTFAFDDCALFTAFATTCTARAKVRKISILNTGLYHPPDPYVPFEWSGWAYHKKRQALFSALRQLSSLTHLELDSCLLRDAREVQAMLRLGMRNLRSVRFIHHPKVKTIPIAIAKPEDGTHRIYPTLRQCVLLRGGLPEEVARAIKGEHRRWTKHRECGNVRRKSKQASSRQRPGMSFVEKAVERHVATEDGLTTSAVAAHRIVNCDDGEMWAELWWKVGGSLPWSQSYLMVGPEQYEPPGWAQMMREKEEREWRQAFPFVDMEL